MSLYLHLNDTSPPKSMDGVHYWGVHAQFRHSYICRVTTGVCPMHHNCVRWFTLII